jgi:small redox-active disulfide protein 2
MEIKVLGTGCSKCKLLEGRTIEAVNQSRINASVRKVVNLIDIMKSGVLTTPALVIDGKVAVVGRVPSVAEIAQIIISFHSK